MINTRIGISLMGIAVALAMAGGAAYAAFSSTNTNSNNTFGSGNMELRINTQAITSSPVFTLTGKVLVM